MLLGLLFEREERMGRIKLVLLVTGAIYVILREYVALT